jgi:periplasmic divalent cation tolerance protein
MTNLVLILTTMPDDDAAAALARTLVEERLAACVNIGAPMTSVYRWRDEIETATERLLIIKTTRPLVEPLRLRMKSLHPYELPEFVVIGSEAASEEYLNWVAAGTRPIGA